MKSITIWFIAFALILVGCSYPAIGDCQTGRFITVSGPNLVLLALSGEQIKAIPYRGYGLAVSPNGQQIAFGSNDGLFVQSLESGESHQILDWPMQEYNPIWSPDGRLLAFSYGFEDDKTVEVIEIASGVTSQELPVRPDKVEMEFALDWIGNNILVERYTPFSGADLVMINYGTGQEETIYSMIAKKRFQYFVADISPDEKFMLLVRGTPDNNFSLLDLSSQVEAVLDRIPQGSKSLTWSPDGKCIAFLYDRNISVYYLQTQKIITLPIQDSAEGYDLITWGVDPENQ